MIKGQEKITLTITDHELGKTLSITANSLEELTTKTSMGTPIQRLIERFKETI